MLTFGASAVLESDKADGGKGISDLSLERMMDRSRLEGKEDSEVISTTLGVEQPGIETQDASLNALDFDGTQDSLSIRNLDGIDYSDTKKCQKRKAEAISEMLHDKASNVADGAPAATKSNLSMAEIAAEWAKLHPDLYEPASKRARVTRYIEVDGHTILKANNYSLEEGEKSVFHSELAANKSQGGLQGRQVAGRDYENEGHCLRCWDGGELLLCDQCCASYHEHCLDPSQLPPRTKSGQPGSMSWACPHHSCKICLRKAHASGGMLFRCTECPVAYCEDHLPVDTVFLNENGREGRFEELGQRKPAQAYFMQCSSNCNRFKQTRTSKSVLDAIIEAKTRKESANS